MILDRLISTVLTRTIMTQEILDKTPSNPYEADLLIMAKMVAGEERTEDEVTRTECQDEDTHLPEADTG